MRPTFSGRPSHAGLKSEWMRATMLFSSFAAKAGPVGPGPLLSAKKLRAGIPPAPVHLSNSTEPFQPLEKIHGHARLKAVERAEPRSFYTGEEANIGASCSLTFWMASNTLFHGRFV